MYAPDDTATPPAGVPRPHAVLRLVIALLLLAAVAQLLRPDPRDQLRAADRLFGTGRYHEALAAYNTLASALPAARMRLGAVRVLRGEPLAAERDLRAAMQAGIPDRDYHLALLYLGRALADDGRPALATATWRLAEDCRSSAACAARAPARVLAAGEAMARGETAAAAAGLLAALAEPLPPGWAALARYRLALLRAPDDPAAALAILEAPAGATSPPQDPLVAPLLPALGDGPAQLTAVLAGSAEARPQLLGQIYLGLGLYALAEDQFARVDPTGPDAVGAAAYAAYTRWRAGDVEGGRARLEALVAAHPGEPRARTLLALAYLATDAPDAAREQLDAVAALTPSDPDLQLAWASWHAARREYDQAALAFERALGQAPPTERGRYALLAARFHLATTYELCERGLPLAEEAGAALGAEPGAQATLAALSYRCGRYEQAAAAAREAQAAGASPEAAFYLGAALVALDDAPAARTALIAAADLAPASDWRRRAEEELARLP
jgi:tetratricopeptide (TPR) repeat protein